MTKTFNDSDLCNIFYKWVEKANFLDPSNNFMRLSVKAYKPGKTYNNNTKKKSPKKHSFTDTWG